MSFKADEPENNPQRQQQEEEPWEWEDGRIIAEAFRRLCRDTPDLQNVWLADEDVVRLLLRRYDFEGSSRVGRKVRLHEGNLKTAVKEFATTVGLGSASGIENDDDDDSQHRTTLNAQGFYLIDHVLQPSVWDWTRRFEESEIPITFYYYYASSADQRHLVLPEWPAKSPDEYMRRRADVQRTTRAHAMGDNDVAQKIYMEWKRLLDRSSATAVKLLQTASLERQCGDVVAIALKGKPPPQDPPAAVDPPKGHGPVSPIPLNVCHGLSGDEFHDFIRLSLANHIRGVPPERLAGAANEKFPLITLTDFFVQLESYTTRDGPVSFYVIRSTDCAVTISKGPKAKNRLCQACSQNAHRVRKTLHTLATAARRPPSSREIVNLVTVQQMDPWRLVEIVRTIRQAKDAEISCLRQKLKRSRARVAKLTATTPSSRANGTLPNKRPRHSDGDDEEDDDDDYDDYAHGYHHTQEQQYNGTGGSAVGQRLFLGYNQQGFLRK